ncbi:hypothetical protein VE00_08257 [Pseudogymnoascus sp. WSF 3629]|nr:hypothetical protein VE00_08257 [Pseudogymnoascus sp. WSF 3629]
MAGRSIPGGAALGPELFQLDDALMPSRCVWIMIKFEKSSPGHWRSQGLLVEASAVAMACVCHWELLGLGGGFGSEIGSEQTVVENKRRRYVQGGATIDFSRSLALSLFGSLWVPGFAALSLRLFVSLPYLPMWTRKSVLGNFLRRKAIEIGHQWFSFAWAEIL